MKYYSSSIKSLVYYPSMESSQIKDCMKNSFDDIVFEGRNKDYGAYVLRRLYDRHMVRGIVTGTLIFLLAISFPILLKYIHRVLPEPIETLKLQEVRLAEVPPIDPKKSAPPLPPNLITRPLNQAVKIVEPMVKKDDEVKEVKNQEPTPQKKETPDSNLIANNSLSKTADRNSTGSDKPGGSAEGNDEGTVYSVVEETPRFPGCEHLSTIPERKKCASDKMLQYLYKNIRYPDIAKLKGIEGQCILTFVVEKDGNITNASIVQDIGGGCGQEALRVIESMNHLTEHWRPGMQRGTPVRVQFSLPLSFKLSRSGL